MTSSNETSEGKKFTKLELFDNVMAGDWKKVVEMYRKYPEAHMAKITRSGDTALHLAVSNGQEDIVKQLVELIIKSPWQHGQSPRETLKIQNESGYTALHFAAVMGNVRMCECIANADPLLVGLRNKESETPLFLAVLYGQQEAFLSLHDIIANTRTSSGYSCVQISEEEAYSYCRRKDYGETILHCAIHGENFHLALHIIGVYKGLIHYVDEEGFSPLDSLAIKPSCFKSGSNLRGWDKIIYKCVYVNELKPISKRSTEVHLRRYPENFQMFVYCIGNVVHFLGRMLKNALRLGLDQRNEGDAENQNKEQTHSGKLSKSSPTQRRRWFPDNYDTCYEFFQLLYKAVLVIFGFGRYKKINLIWEEKEKHVWAVRFLRELLENLPMYDSLDLQSGANPGAETGELDRDHVEIVNAIHDNEGAYREEDKIEEKEGAYQEEDKTEEKKKSNKTKPGKEHKETAILVAAKNGIVEIVDEILKRYPVAIHDADENMKNILLLAAEHRQIEVYKLLLRHEDIPSHIVFRKLDNNRNSALHFAAKYDEEYHKPWPVPGAALQVQWEIKWYKFVEESMPPQFFSWANKDGKTPEEIFAKTHKGLVKDGGDWLTNTSQACSVVAGLFVTIAFTTSITVPGGTMQDETGEPYLLNQTAFKLFAISSQVAFYSSLFAVVVFLAILTSKYHMSDFYKALPWKILLGLTALYVSIASTLMSFCSANYFVLKAKLKHAASPVYVATCLVVTLFAMAQFPLYFQLLLATFKKVPEQHRSADELLVDE